VLDARLVSFINIEVRYVSPISQGMAAALLAYSATALARATASATTAIRHTAVVEAKYHKGSIR
jgi:hypothetical protein